MERLVTKESMMQMLADNAKRQHVIGRALVALFHRQTADEKQANHTENTNAIGFSQSDARSGSLTARFYMKHNRLEDWMIEKWMKDFRGAPRITKYWRQLDEIAKAKRAKQQGELNVG